MRVDTNAKKFGHTEVGDLGSTAGNQQDVVAGEVTVDDIIGVEVIEGEGYVMAEVDLDVVGEWQLGSFEEVGEAFVHELHQKRWEFRVGILDGPKVLNYVWVFHCAKKVALLLELSPGVIPRLTELDKKGMQEFGSTRE